MKKLAFVLIFGAVVVGLAWHFGTTDSGINQQSTTQTGVPVRVVRIARRTLRSYVIAYGTVVPEPAGERPAASVRLTPATPGVVVAVHTREGQRVSPSDVLFDLDGRAAEVAVSFAEKALERERELLRVGGTSPKALQQAEQTLEDARVQRSLLRISAPLSGTVTRLNVAPGEAVDTTTVMAEIVDLQRLAIAGNVPAVESAGLELGKNATVLAEMNGTPVSGTLAFIGSSVDVQTGAVPIRVSVPENSGYLPGQFVTVRIVSETRDDCLVVPVNSVVEDQEGKTVVALVQNSIAVLKRVKTGLHDGDLVQIEGEGLQAGMTVVTEGAYALPDETGVRVLGQ